MAWSSVDLAVANATCIDTPAPVANTVLPGDICTKDTDCLGTAGVVKCTNGACTTTNAVGGDCNTTAPAKQGSEWCPAGSFCDIGGTKKCVAQKAVNAQCASALECPTNTACIKVLPADTNPK